MLKAIRAMNSGRPLSKAKWREAGLDLEVIRTLLGHSTLLVTQRYLNINEDELMEAMQEKSGREPERLSRIVHAETVHWLTNC